MERSAGKLPEQLGMARGSDGHYFTPLRQLGNPWWLALSSCTEDMEGVMPLVTKADELLALIDEYRTFGFDDIYIHNVSRDQAGFISFMARDVLPAIKPGFERSASQRPGAFGSDAA